MTEIEGQKDVLPELDSYRYKTSEEAKQLPLATQLLRLEHINTQLCHDHNTLLIDAANQQRRADAAEAHIRSTREEIQHLCESIIELKKTAESQHQQDVEKMKRAVEVLKEEVAKPWYNSGIYSLTAIARKAISILSPDTEGGGK